MKRSRWVVLALLVPLLATVGLLCFGMKESDRHQTQHEAIAHSCDVLLACESYYRHPDSGKKYPSGLTDLVEPPFGGSSFLRERDLIDPWGNPYRFATVRGAKGDTELYVWAERVVGGKRKLLGAKMAPGGQPELFGLPEG
ncbi:MAG: type II secretion system protein GspG [Planctomycetes bacterium]|nr:type II secretion system protein GspG [Planctomycetota bacterium]